MIKMRLLNYLQPHLKCIVVKAAYHLHIVSKCQTRCAKVGIKWMEGDR
jgi:hypothetical protein